MWSTSPPPVSADEAVRACIAGIGNQRRDLKGRVTSQIAKFAVNSDYLKHAVDNGICHLFDRDTFDIPAVDSSELVWLYDNQVAKLGRPARQIYDRIIHSSSRVCAYCQYGRSTTLDHFVPKSKHPGLAIVPWNLVPCCRDCNHNLREIFSDQPEEQFLHPYSTPNLGRWLFGEVVHSTPTVVRFYPQPHSGLPDQIRERVSYQFRTLGLNQMYSEVSARDLTETSRMLESIGRFDGPIGVRRHLEQTATAASVGLGENSRRAALFEALSNDEWYYAGGYAMTTT